MTPPPLPGRAGPRPPQIERFLGPEALQRGPFGLLGVTPSFCTDEHLLAALQRQLARVDAHSEAESAEAQRVRHALYSAASSLRDQHQFEAMVRQWGEPGDVVRTEPPSPRAPIMMPVDDREWREERATNRAVYPIIGMAVGGLIFLAALLTMLLLASNTQPKPGPVPAPPAAPTPASVASAPIAPASPNSAPTPVQPSPAPISPAATAPPSQPLSFVDAHAAVRGLKSAAAAARKAPDEALATLQAAMGPLGNGWVRLDPPQRQSAIDSVIEIVFAISSSSESAERVMTAIAAGALPLASDQPLAANEIWPAAWSVGLLSRLARERSLVDSVSSKIDQTMDQVLGSDRPHQDGTFEAGAIAALTRMPERLMAPPSDRAAAETTAACKAWAEAAAALLPDSNDAERFLADGLERILLNGPEPDTDPGAFAAVQTLATQIKWRRGGPARTRVLDWFRDQRVTSSDLQVLTQALTTASAAENVGPAMTLTAAATAADREQLRTQYATAWSVAEAAGGTTATRDWTQASVDILQRTVRPSSDVEALAGAAELGRLNLAARLLWQGDPVAAAGEFGRAGQLLESTPSQAARSGKLPALISPANVGSDGQWAVSYLAAGQNIPVRMARLEELERNGGSLGVVDAEVLAEAACFAPGGEGKVRHAAQTAAAKFAALPVMTEAMLEVLPRAPRIDSISELISKVAGQGLPPVTDPGWALAARRALVERLIEQLASGGAGVSANMDRLARELAHSYEPGEQQPSSGEEPQPITTAGPEALWRSLHAEAERLTPNLQSTLTLEQIDNRRAGRRALAAGPVQAWAAEQVSVAELLAYVTVGERSTRARTVAQIMDDMSIRRRESKHIFEQLHASERAMLRLWLLRLGQEGAWTGS